MEDEIIVKYIRIEGQLLENPPPRFCYEVKVGTWAVVDQTETRCDFFMERRGQDVEVEVGMQFGTLRGVGKVKLWQGSMPDAPTCVATINGSSPLSYVEK